MKKVIKSLALVVVVGAIAGVATYSFFSDTETSTGNTFTAGAIDLKVDHKYTMYDGNPCTKDCVENSSTNLIQNGSFEVPEVTDPAKWQIFASGTSGLEWTVEWNGGSATYNSRPRPEPALAEYHEGVLGAAQHGDQYAELDSDWFGPNDPLNGEPALTKIYQNISTTPGAKYKLHYYFAPRPNTGSSENTMYANIDGVQIAQNGPVAGGGSIVWTESTYEFTATNASTKVEFIGGGTNNSLGVFLDNVSVHPYDCDYQIVGGTCTLWDLKDLGQSDYFWNFGDVKPGDYGINIISLHAYDNNAYACLFTDNVVDKEETVNDPEIEAGDNIASVIGELSGYIKLFIWEDANENNAYDTGETIFAGPDASIDIAMDKISLTESHTKYIGFAWCAGTQTLDSGIIKCDGSSMGNIAQTDTMTADITAYAEQQRNNAGFTCSNSD